MPTQLEIANRALARIGDSAITAPQLASPDDKKSRAIVSAMDLIRDEVVAAAPWNSATARKTIAETAITTVLSATVGAGPAFLVTVNFNAAHTLVALDRFRIADVLGMTNLNGVWRKADVDADSLTLLDENGAAVSGSGWGTYTSGGTLYKVPDWDWDRQYALPADCLKMLSVDGQQSGDDWAEELGLILTDLTSPISIRYIRKITDYTTFDVLLASAMASRLAVEICEELTQSGPKRDRAWAEYKRICDIAEAADAREQTPESLEEGSWVTARFGDASWSARSRWW